LKENGISQEDINKKTPQELMEILRNKKPTETAQAPTSTETPISEANSAIGLTQEAKDILEKIEKEKVFMPYVAENLSRILKENGISQEDINKKTPQELMEILRNKKPTETTQAPVPTETPKPEVPAEAQRQPVEEVVSKETSGNNAAQEPYIEAVGVRKMIEAVQRAKRLREGTATEEDKNYVPVIRENRSQEEIEDDEAIAMFEAIQREKRLVGSKA
jgi:hypothetical protein